VGHELDLGPYGLAHRTHKGDIAAGLDLELHFLVACPDRLPSTLDQRSGCGLEPEGNPRRDGIAKSRAAAAQMPAQRPAELDSFRAPAAHLEGAFGHGVAADFGDEPSVNIRGAVNSVAEQTRCEPFPDREPRRVDGTRRVDAALARDNLSPTR